jgi:hypothetical protein
MQKLEPIGATGAALAQSDTRNAPGFATQGLEPLRALSDRLTQLRLALSQLAGLGDKDTRAKVARLAQMLERFEPAVTMIGQVKSGKTTLVNAMAGAPDLLPADVNPWTSVVTSLHLAAGGAALGSGARFRFFDANEWDLLLRKGGRIGELAGRAGADREMEKIRTQIEAMRDKTRTRLGRKFELLLGQDHTYDRFDRNLIERYICLGDFSDDGAASGLASTQGRFADITRSADLFLTHDAMPLPICLRDTPGVNDTFMMREQITIRAIRDSRLCVVVLSAHQALTSVDMALIRLIANVRAREVVIFINRIDELSDPSAQVPEIEASIRRTLKDHDGPADARILFGSALWANHALSGDLAGLPTDSAAALHNWAKPTDAVDDAGAVWRLSGLPALFRALADRIATGPGKELVDRVARSAINLASGLQVSGSMSRHEDGFDLRITGRQLDAAMIALADLRFRELEAELEKLVTVYHQRLDRAHESFIDRATESLLTHLENSGDDKVWEYSPTGLRMLLRSAYNVFGAGTQAAVQRALDGAVADLRTLCVHGFGEGGKKVGLGTPDTHRIPPPVFIGQTIALDVKGTWWQGWWRRWRGYNAYARKFHDLIRAETDPIIAELKEQQTEAVCLAAMGTLDEYLDEQRVVLTGILESCEAGTAPVVPRGAGTGAGDDQRRRALSATLESLIRIAA